jgi:formylglycine-generating enzyme required for sulfatase activity
MIGNVWEWTCTPWQRPVTASGDGCHAGGCAGRGAEPSAAANLARVIKGGSHLCAKNYCQRYRPAARHPQASDSPTGHIGFRCVRLAGVCDGG